MNFKKKSLVLAIAATNTIASPAVFAESESARQIEEIVVTATRRESSMQDIPYNISAVTGKTLEDALIVDNADLMRAIPGVSVVDRGYRNSGVINGIMIRGLNIDGSALGDYALNTVPTVSTYINDTPLYANFILKDINRVEVLRGPQGTLYGSGSLGGTVKYIMNEPSVEGIEANFNTTVSETDGSSGTNLSYDGVVNFPLGDKAAIRIMGGALDYAGITDYVNVYQLDSNGIPVAPSGVLSNDASFRNVKDADDVDIKYGRISLLWEPSDSIKAVLAYQAQSDDIGGRRQSTTGEDGFGRTYKDYENGSIQLEPSSRDVELFSLEADFDLGFATLTSSSSYYEHQGDSISENTGFYAQIGFLPFYYNYPRPMASAERTFENNAFVQELRLVSNGDNTIDWVVGAYYMDQDLNSTQMSYLRGFQSWWNEADIFGLGSPINESLVLNENDFDYERDENFKDTALFGEITYHVSDTFRVTGGLRYFDNKFTNDTRMAVGLYSFFNIVDTASFKTTESDTLFKVNFAWDLSQDHMAYGTISEGYRRGGTNAVPVSGPFAEDPGFQRFDSDSVVNYELGLKGSTSLFRYSAAVFYVDWKDIQVNTATTNWAFFAAVNGDSARSQGLELEVDGFIGERLHYAVGYAYVDAELTDDVLNPTGGVLALDGAQLPGTAEHTFNIAIDHTSELFGMPWVNRLGGYYQSTTQNAVNADTTSPGRFNVQLDSFSIWDFTSTVEGESWAVSLWIKNLTNEKGITGTFTETYMGTSPAQNYFGNGNKDFIAVPKTIGVALRYKM